MTMDVHCRDCKDKIGEVKVQLLASMDLTLLGSDGCRFSADQDEAYEIRREHRNHCHENQDNTW